MFELSYSRPAVSRFFGLRNDLEHLFSNGFAELSRRAHEWNPALDVYEDKDTLYVKAELPGLKKEDIDVSLEDGVLTLSGERKSDEKLAEAQTYRTERFVGPFERSLTLPSEVKADQVSAQYADGILTITLPKAEAAKPKQIEVKVS